MNDKYEVEILLQIKSHLDELVKTKKGLKEIKDTVDNTNNDAKKNTGLRDSIVGMQQGVRGILQPLTMLRRTVWQIGLAWALTGGAAVAAIIDIGNKIKELDTLSIDLGVSVEELSKQFYGVNIATKEARAAADAWAVTLQSIKDIKIQVESAVTNAVGKWAIDIQKQNILMERIMEYERVTGKGVTIEQTDTWRKEIAGQMTEGLAYEAKEIKRNSTEGIAARKSMLGAIDKMNMSSYEVRIKQIDNEAKKMVALAYLTEKEAEDYSNAQRGLLAEEKKKSSRGTEVSILKMMGRETDAFLLNQKQQTYEYERAWGGDGEMIKLRKQFTDLELEEFKRSLLGLKSTYDIMKTLNQDTVGAFRSSFTSFFSDTFKGETKSAKEYFYNFLMDIGNAWSKMMAEMAVNSIFNQSGSSGGFSWVGLGKSVLSAFGGGGGGGGGSGSASILSTAANTGVNSGYGGGDTPSKGVSVDITDVKGYASGGIAGRNGPELVRVGENGPEMISPLSGSGGGGGSQTTVTYYIHAIDAASFAALVSRNPEIIVDVTNKAIQRNKGIRRTIQEYT